MNTCSISLQILPLHKSNADALEIIDKVIQYIQKTGVDYEVGPMETTMEGDLSTLLKIVEEVQHICIKKGAGTVFSNIKIIYNPLGIMTTKEKVQKYRKL
jgi:uncharacterized protein YqgV (UPF0045/DUF77 family)